jgi:DNA/RNA endonuclease G (NUC1)
VLGGGFKTRPYGNKFSYSGRPLVLPNRTQVSVDNTALPALRGDYAVPTLFNGNFDAISPGWSTVGSNQLIAGWSTGGNGQAPITQSQLFTWSQIARSGESPAFQAHLNKMGAITFGGNYALKLGGGQSITHNNFLVPDWGALRFDLHTSSGNSGTLDVFLTVDGQNYNLGALSSTRPTITLAQGNAINQISYGVRGFETFQLEIPKSLRGRVGTLTFRSNASAPIYLDNVFFQSQHLLLGNPEFNDQEARSDLPDFSNNYLIEKPQFALSYNESTKTPNWVSWQLNSSWLGGTGRYDSDFRGDTDLPGGLTRLSGRSYENSSYDRGHMIPAADRRRPLDTPERSASTDKDERATFVMTNVVPQFIDNNRFFGPRYTTPELASAWLNLEVEARNIVLDGNKELYIIAGSTDENSANQIRSRATQRERDNPVITNPRLLKDQGIKIPGWTWKVITILDPGQGISDITAATSVIAVMTPNQAEPLEFYLNTPTPVEHPLYPGRFINNPTEWRNWRTWQVSIDRLESLTRLDLLTNVPEAIQRVLEARVSNFGATTSRGSTSDLGPDSEPV